MYPIVFRVFFARFDPEAVHHLVAAGLRISHRLGLTRLFRLAKNETRSVVAFGLSFEGPFGLAAGFDKDGTMILPLADLGFSHIEVGTVTALAQPGNEKPRLFRLVADRALINRMGFNNQGSAVLANRLERLRNSGKKLPIIGVNIGKSKVTPIENAVTDYVTSTKLLALVWALAWGRGATKVRVKILKNCVHWIFKPLKKCAFSVLVPKKCEKSVKTDP
jgi:dihydroorotate dehydrogenase